MPLQRKAYMAMMAMGKKAEMVNLLNLMGEGQRAASLPEDMSMEEIVSKLGEVRAEYDQFVRRAQELEARPGYVPEEDPWKDG